MLCFVRFLEQCWCWWQRSAIRGSAVCDLGHSGNAAEHCSAGHSACGGGILGVKRQKVNANVALHSNPISELRDVISLATWDHTLLPATRHK